MNKGLIPRRYAKALLMLSQEHQTDAAVYEAMEHIDAAFVAEPSLQLMLSNPAVGIDAKSGLILMASEAKGAARSEVEGFVTLLDRNRRLGDMHQCALAYMRLYREAHKIYKVCVTSAAPLLDEEFQRIKSLVERQLPEGASADFDRRVAPELIGGFTVSIDNELLDASVANELKQLRIKLLSH